jgi:predicted DNA-binding antitoxin AbrB/MazE fold protein
MIEAVYENGIFKPPGPVNLPEGAHVRLPAEASTTVSVEELRRRLISAGTDPLEAERILDNLRLVWDSYDSLTEDQQAAMDQARLDQERFSLPT